MEVDPKITPVLCLIHKFSGGRPSLVREVAEIRDEAGQLVGEQVLKSQFVIEGNRGCSRYFIIECQDERAEARVSQQLKETFGVDAGAVPA